MRLFQCFFVLFFVCAYALAGTDHDITPESYAAEEATASFGYYGQSLCHQSQFICRSVTSDNDWYTLWPNFQEREMVMRLNRTNVALMYRNWVAIPKDLKNTSYMSLSPFPAHFNTRGEKLILVDLHLFAFGAYDAQGQLLYWGPASSGAEKCADVDASCKTATGDFRIFRMQGEDCTSNEYPLETDGGAPMPYCLFFHGGIALHASTLSGFINRSGGCVRLFYDDAKWLYEDFAKVGTRVVVTNDYHQVVLSKRTRFTHTKKAIKRHKMHTKFKKKTNHA